jgi:predicted porin
MGSEDLGGGLKANFKLEQGFNSDTGASAAPGTTFGREAWVGFSGGWGEVRFGNAYTAIDDIWGAGNAVFDSAFSPTGSVWTGGYNGRPFNVIRYQTPGIGGFVAGISYSLNEAAAGTQTTSGYIQYAAGPLAVALGHQVGDPSAGANSPNLKSTILNGSYDLGAAKLMASYSRVSNVGGMLNNDVRQYQLGVDVPVSSALTLSASYAYSRDTLATGDKRSGFGLGAQYDLSKRTSLYAGYHDSDAEARIGGAKTDEFRLFAVGVRHKF